MNPYKSQNRLPTTAAPLLSLLVVWFSLCGSSTAGEWMFRLKEAHIQLRKALRTRDAELAWECVNRATRQEAGILAGRIRQAYGQLSDEQRMALKKALGVEEDQQVRNIHGRDLLVSPFFVDAHPQVLSPDRDEARLKEHGTRMALPTAIVVNKHAANEHLVVYTFSTEGHFGGQAMDYRAQLEIPSLDSILGTDFEVPTPSDEEIARDALHVFSQLQEALRNEDFDALWPLLDCVSQSQACHFADQAREQAAKKSPELIADKLGISADELMMLDGRRVWGLPWSKSDLQCLTAGTNAKYLPADRFDHKLLPVPEGYHRRDKPGPPEAVIQFESQGRAWQIPARLNYRDGTPKVTLFVKSPFYLRLRK